MFDPVLQNLFDGYSLINTPLQRGASMSLRFFNRFNGFQALENTWALRYYTFAKPLSPYSPARLSPKWKF